MESAGKAISASEALRAAIAADVDLEEDLLKDVAYKGAQLAFVSVGTYTCGDPKDPYTRRALRIPMTPTQIRMAEERWDKKQEDVEKKLRAQIAALDVILAYGDNLATVTKAFADTRATIGKFKAALTAFRPFADPQTLLYFAAVENGADLVSLGVSVVQDGTIIAIARNAQKVLDDAFEKLTVDGSFTTMSRDELRAYGLWESCARERLAWLRGNFPPVNWSEVSQKNAGLVRARIGGMDRSSVLHFASEYQAYLTQREGFIGRRPNYSKLVGNIIKANKAIGASKPGEDIAYILDNMTYAGTNAAAIEAARMKFKESVGAANM